MALILYVEDHPPAQLLMQAIVADLTAHRLLTAATGESACKIAAEHLPDLYIVDLDLPDTDGLTLAVELHAIHHAPLLLTSAYGEAVKNAPDQPSITAYLAKPLDPDNVAETIQRTLA